MGLSSKGTARSSEREIDTTWRDRFRFPKTPKTENLLPKENLVLSVPTYIKRDRHPECIQWNRTDTMLECDLDQYSLGAREYILVLLKGSTLSLIFPACFHKTNIFVFKVVPVSSKETGSESVMLYVSRCNNLRIFIFLSWPVPVTSQLVFRKWKVGTTLKELKMEKRHQRHPNLTRNNFCTNYLLME